MTMTYDCTLTSLLSKNEFAKLLMLKLDKLDADTVVNYLPQEIARYGAYLSLNKALRYVYDTLLEDALDIVIAWDSFGKSKYVGSVLMNAKSKARKNIADKLTQQGLQFCLTADVIRGKLPPVIYEYAKQGDFNTIRSILGQMFDHNDLAIKDRPLKRIQWNTNKAEVTQKTVVTDLRGKFKRHYWKKVLVDSFVGDGSVNEFPKFVVRDTLISN